MEFEHLLRKYLAASISDAELQRFRDLLERSPEYRLELRQVLELRSLIQDDALGLAPPENLSANIQLTVGELFAAENPVRKKREEERRRAVVFPFRIAAGVMATTFVALMVALGPSMIDRFGNAAFQPVAGVARMTVQGGSAAAPAMPDARTAPSLADAASVNVPASVLARATGRHEAGRRHGRSAASSAATVAVPSQPVQEAQHDAIADASFSAPPSTPSVVLRSDEGTKLLPEDAKLLSQLGLLNLDNLPYHPQFDDPASTGSDAAAREDMAKSSTMADAHDPRRLTVGMMLGSGRVTETQTPTPLIQNSYYFAFNVGSNDRIGLEMGTSAFQQDRSVTSFVTPAGAPLAKQTSSDDPAKEDGQKSSAFNRQLTLINERAEQQITYGTIFYDRKMKVSDNWDLCGRVGVGAADNALVGHLRAYAAFSPSKKVTFTVGLGGSGLKSLNSRGASGSGNYGIYYGIETGF
jgi:hypothetical protein